MQSTKAKIGENWELIRDVLRQYLGEDIKEREFYSERELREILYYKEFDGVRETLIEQIEKFLLTELEFLILDDDNRIKCYCIKETFYNEGIDEKLKYKDAYRNPVFNTACNVGFGWSCFKKFHPQHFIYKIMLAKIRSLEGILPQFIPSYFADVVERVERMLVKSEVQVYGAVLSLEELLKTEEEKREFKTYLKKEFPLVFKIVEGGDYTIEDLKKRKFPLSSFVFNRVGVLAENAKEWKRTLEILKRIPYDDKINLASYKDIPLLNKKMEKLTELMIKV